MQKPIDQPGWLTAGWAEFGQRETPGQPTNPRIRKMFAEAGHPAVVSDEVAWCAAFVGACLERSAVRSSRSLLARSYLSWGDGLDAPRLGAIAVFSRGSDPAAGHVALLIGQTASQLVVLGGNQGDGVTVAAFAKADLLGLRWPAVAPPSDAHSAPVLDPGVGFEDAFAHVLRMEGGYTNDPADPGGPTNLGITLADYARATQTPITPATRQTLIANLKVITPAEARPIYFNRYWRPAGCPDLPPAVAIFHFDTAVNMGTGTAIRMLQTALMCPIDGEFGPQTKSAAAHADPRSLLAAYADLRRRRYRSLSIFPRFGRGWLSRVDATLSRSLALTAKATSEKGPRTMPIDQTTLPVQPKWWGQSLTIWGAVVTGLAAVLPAVGPAFGIDVTPTSVHTAADQIGAIAQAAAGLAGTLVTIFGRLRANQPLQQRLMTLKI